MVIAEIRKIDSSLRKLKEFGFLVGGVLCALGLLLCYRGKPNGLWYLVPGMILVLAGVLRPGILKPFQKAWMTLAILMGWVMTRVLLTVLFYLALVPIGLIMRISGKDPLDRKLEPKQPSYWKSRKTGHSTPSDCEKQY